MSTKKRVTATSKATDAVKGPLIESIRINEDGRKLKIPPGRVHADDVLGRIRVVRRTITLRFSGEYEAELTYEAR